MKGKKNNDILISNWFIGKYNIELSARTGELHIDVNILTEIRVIPWNISGSEYISSDYLPLSIHIQSHMCFTHISPS